VLKKIKDILKGSGESLVQRVLHSMSWVIVFQALSQILTFVKSVVLARLLIPADFGLVGIAFLAIAFVDVFSNTGFFQALIQKKSNIKEYLNTTWSISIIRGLILTVLLFFAAPLIADFFKEPLAVNVIRVLALTILINEFTNVGVVYFIKELEYKKNYRLHLISDIISFITAVALAFILKDVWALVYSQLVNKIIYVALSYYYHPYRPSFSINFARAKELFRFGKYLTVSSMLSYFIQQGDKAVIGRLLDAASLGFYSVGYRFASFFSEPVNNIIISIAFPAYSKIQDDLVKVKDYYLKTIKFASLLSVPFFFGTLLLAEEFTVFVLGVKWIEAVPIIKILSALGIVSTLNALNNSISLSLGHPKTSTYGLIVQIIVFVFSVIPLTLFYGLQGTASALVFSNVVYFFFTFSTLKSVLGIKYVEIGRLYIPSLLSSILMILIVELVKSVTINAILMLSFSVAAGGLIYISVLLLSDKYFGFFIITDIKTILKKSV
jgi:lipopolysaccharide exporter